MKKLLLAEDIAANRALLKAGLRKDYEIAEAADGAQAMEYIRAHHKTLSAVLLDISMPVLDGYEVLRQMREDPLLAQIPVIVLTASGDEATRIRALTAGADDFATKPYQFDIIRHCLRNNIARHESASILNAIQRDKLTGLYNREFFLLMADRLIGEASAGSYMLSCLDVDGFKLINDRLGTVEGDRILKRIGAALGELRERVGALCGRFSADNFALLYPNRPEVIRMVNDCCDSICESISLTISVGCCAVTEPSVPASALYDRARLAQQSVKGRYDTHIAIFDESMLHALLQQQQINNEMVRALENREFEVWFQPQYNHATGALIGAEALVRWQHPQKGLIMPGVFIPVFEQNGFIYELDKYVWEQTCRCLRRWLDEGRSPLPVSVNISRYDVLREDYVAVLQGLLEKYRLSVELLRLEITESAFTQSPGRLVQAARRLIALGFTVEIDDFGSGYSSLNTLKDVPTQILKLDMRFLDDNGDSRRGGNILESIVRMAKWLGMSVIAEGVETQEQADFLASIGCVQVQGYFYAKPMPTRDFESLLSSAGKELQAPALKTIEELQPDKFWNPSSLDTLIFSSYVGAACVLELTENRCEAVRVNKKFMQAVETSYTIEEVLRCDPVQSLDPQDFARFRELAAQAAGDGKEFSGLCRRTPQQSPARTITLRYTGRVIAQTDRRTIVYLLIENITLQKQAEEERESLSLQLQEIMRCISNGVAAYTTDENGSSLLFSNHRFCELLDCTEDELHDPLSLPGLQMQDASQFIAAHNSAAESQTPFGLDFRIKGKNGELRWLHCAVSFMQLPQYSRPVRVYVLTDITKQMSIRQMLPIALSTVIDASSEISFIKDRELRYVCCNQPFAQIVGQPDVKQVLGKTDFELVSPEYARRYQAEELQILRTGQPLLNYNTLIPTADGSLRYSSTSKYPLLDESGEVVGIYGVCLDTTKAHDTYARLKLFNDSLPGGIATFEITPERTRIVYFNEGFFRSSGYSRDAYLALAENDPFFWVYDEDKPSAHAAVQQIIDGKERTGMGTYRCQTKDGSLRWFSLTGCVTQRQANTCYVNAVKYDITEQMEAEQRLSESSARLQLLLDNIPGGLATYQISPDGVKLVFFNDGYCAIFGMSREEYAAQAVNDPYTGVAAQDKPRLAEQVEALMRHGTAAAGVYRVQPRNGASRRIRCQVAVCGRKGDTVTVNLLLLDADRI